MSLLIHKPLNTAKEKNRIWLQGKHILNFFNIGDRLEVIDEKDGESITIRKVSDNHIPSRKNSIRSVSRKVSPHGGGISAIVEINEANSEILKNFKTKQLVYIHVDVGCIRISIDKNSLEQRIQRRVNRIKNRLANGEPLEKADIFCGGGTGAIMAHEGLKLAGIPSVLRYALDNYDQAIENIASNGLHMFASSSLVMHGDINGFDASEFEEVDIISITSSCVDLSIAGKAKKKIQ